MGDGWERQKERERENRLQALRPARPHTVGYIGVCDQEQGVIECPLQVLCIVIMYMGTFIFGSLLSEVSFPLALPHEFR